MLKFEFNFSAGKRDIYKEYTGKEISL